MGINSITCEGHTEAGKTGFGEGNRNASDFEGTDMLTASLLTLAGAVAFGGLAKVASAAASSHEGLANATKDAPQKLDKVHMEPGDEKFVRVPHQDGTNDVYRIKYVGNGHDLDRKVPDFDITRYRDGLPKEHYGGPLPLVDNSHFGNGTKVLDLSISGLFAGTSNSKPNGFVELSTILHDSEKYAHKAVHTDSYGRLAENVGLKAGDSLSLHTDDGIWDVTLRKAEYALGSARNAVLDVVYSGKDGRDRREAHNIELGMGGAQQKEVYLVDPSDLKGSSGIHPQNAEILGLRLDFAYKDRATGETVIGLSAKESGKHAFLQTDGRAFDGIAGHYGR